ncbi:unnamed protein product, partial [Chrysoparadoxa australica]
VIGAGVAGVAAAKVLIEDGFNVTVFEKLDSMGGVWKSGVQYYNLATQAPDGWFEYAEMRNVGDCTSAEAVEAYMEEYCRRFNVTRCIKYSTEVVSVQRVGDLNDPLALWSIQTCGTEGEGQVQEHRFTHLVVCNGHFHVPSLPRWSNDVGAFRGKVMHSTDVKSADMLAGKRVIVVGGGKSSMDMTQSSAQVASSTLQLMRNAPLYTSFEAAKSHWDLWSLVKSLTPLDKCDLGRCSLSVIVVFLTCPPATSSQLMRHNWRKEFSTPYGLEEGSAIDSDPSVFSRCESAVMRPLYFELYAQGKFKVQSGEIQSFTEDGVVLADGEVVACDVVVCATGYQLTWPFFEEELGSSLGVSFKKQQVRLYRGIAPPRACNVAFVGLVGSAINPTVFEIQSQWVSELFLGRMKLPSTSGEMENAIERRVEFHKQWNGERYGSAGVCLASQEPWYMDELMLDMGLPER